MNLLIKLRKDYRTEYLGTYVIRLFDIDRLLQPWLAIRDQTTLPGTWVAESFRRFRENNILFIDPALEYLYYEFHLHKFDSPRVPRVFANYVRECNAYKDKLERAGAKEEYFKWKQAKHKLFWKELDEDSRERDAMLGETRDIELGYGADILLPPVPLITSEKLLDISIRINEIFREISRQRAESATYFMFQSSALKSETLIEKIKQYITEEDKSDLTILKFKNLDVEKRGALFERQTYKDLMRDLAFVKQTNLKRVFMLLESGHQAFPSAVSAFDIVSTSLTGLDGDSKYGKDPYGMWYDPQKMVHRPFEDVIRIFRNNGGHLPCPCQVCRQITNLRALNSDEWNISRRLHYGLTMNSFMSQIARAIGERNPELARDKLADSDIANLKELIPRF